jgi:preprotein translocase subunit SecG
MIYVLTFVHILVCVFLVIVVLLQSGKAADVAAAFGGMGSQTAFGPRGTATALSRATTVAAGLFMVTSMVLAIMATGGAGPGVGGSVLDQTQRPAQQQQSAPMPGAQRSAPAPAPVQPAPQQQQQQPATPPQK